jgi:hypothetical protein
LCSSAPYVEHTLELNDVLISAARRHLSDLTPHRRMALLSAALGMYAHHSHRCKHIGQRCAPYKEAAGWELLLLGYSSFEVSEGMPPGICASQAGRSHPEDPILARRDG